MMRYLEWLFPVQRHIRRRREVGALPPVATILGLLALISLTPIFAYMVRMVAFWVNGGMPADRIVDAVVREIAWFLGYRWRDLVGAVAAGAAVLTVLLGLEFLVAIIFVRTRRGRRRPICTWQTGKYVMLSARSWALVCVLGLLVLSGLALAFRDADLSESASMTLLVTTATVLTATPLLLGGALAVQAAQAVIVLQDDRRCEKCGYFLIRLTAPRCPECGTPFDPAKLGQLSLVRPARDVELPTEGR